MRSIARFSPPRSRTIPDQEGTEIQERQAGWRSSFRAAERSPIRRGLKLCEIVRRGLHATIRSRTIPDQEGTEMNVRIAGAHERCMRSRTIPDQEGTEIQSDGAQVLLKNSAAERSPIRRGLKLEVTHGAFDVFGPRSRTIPDQEGTEIELIPDRLGRDDQMQQNDPRSGG